MTQDEAAPAEDGGSTVFHQELKKRFIEGGPGFMGIVLLCLILGSGHLLLKELSF